MKYQTGKLDTAIDCFLKYCNHDAVCSLAFLLPNRSCCAYCKPLLQPPNLLNYDSGRRVRRSASRIKNGNAHHIDKGCYFLQSAVNTPTCAFAPQAVGTCAPLSVDRSLRSKPIRLQSASLLPALLTTRAPSVRASAYSYMFCDALRS